MAGGNCIRDMDRSIAQNWETPFIVSGLVALIPILGGFYRKKIFNRVLLGLNLYLLTGGIALITHQWWLNRLYGRFQGSGMLAWVVLVGLVSMVASSRGFIGVDCPDAKQVKVFSLYLLLVSMGAFLISFGFQGNPPSVRSDPLYRFVCYTSTAEIQACFTTKSMILSKISYF